MYSMKCTAVFAIIYYMKGIWRIYTDKIEEEITDKLGYR